MTGGVKMSPTDKETPETKNERLRQKELKRTPIGNLNDAFNRAGSGSLIDLVDSLGWKGLGVLILILIIGFIVASIFF